MKMGNIKTNFIKRIGKKLYDSNTEKFTDDYTKNKELVNGMVDIKSKKLRNTIAGYITKLKKIEQN